MAIVSFPKERKSFLIRLIKGEISLPVTYWVFGYIANILFLAIQSYMLECVKQKGQWDSIYDFFIFWSFSIFAIIYSIFICIAIWNSADNYKGRKLWATLSKAAVLLGIALAATEFREFF